MATDADFYRRRLSEELRRAESSTDEGLRALHARWADLYRQRLRGSCSRVAPLPANLP